MNVPPDDLLLVEFKPRPSAEARASAIAFCENITKGKPCPAAKWLIQRETKYWDKFHRTWPFEAINYQAAIDFICWSTGKTEVEFLGLNQKRPNIDREMPKTADIVKKWPTKNPIVWLPADRFWT